ncbi:MAG: VCBS repeat-containing protein [Verrucomicrobiales bacterium]|nr:VCBS repeat-containing protein [Verrucomicrobiales bacterium]
MVLSWTTVANTAGSPDAAAAAPEPLRGTPLRATRPGPAGLRFEPLTPAATGLDFVHRWNTAARYERLLNSSMVGGGVAVGDYDGDGRPDLFLTRPAGGGQLYRNTGDLRFTNVTDQAGVRDPASWTTGATFADVNGDGRPDLFVCCYDGPNRLYLNRSHGTFQEAAAAAGVDFHGASVMAAFADYDRDGDLDFYLLTAGMIPNASQRFRVKFVDGRPVVPEELQEFWQLIYQPGDRAAAVEAGQFDRLYRNNGDGTFTEVGQAAGIVGCDFGNAVLWWDYNHDGWPDLYVANDYFGPDRLYRNNTDGTFTDVTRDLLPHTPWTSMGADVGDFNNDGLLDLITSDMSGTTHFQRLVALGDQERSGWFLDLAEPRQYLRNALFLNSGLGRFLELAHLAGLADTDWTWSIRFADLDDDGWLDVFVPNGMTRDWMDNDLAARAKDLSPAEFVRFWRAQPVRRDINLAFRNRRDLTFESVAPAWGLDHPGPSFGAVATDLDADGRLDLVINDFEAPARLYRNTGQDTHRVTIRLEGAGGNPAGIGATVRLLTTAGIQMRYVTPSRGFMSADDARVHFGLGDATRIEELSVRWPQGQVQVFTNLPADHAYTMTEPRPPRTARPPQPGGAGVSPAVPTSSTSNHAPQEPGTRAASVLQAPSLHPRGSPSLYSTAQASAVSADPAPSPLFLPATAFAGSRHQAVPLDDFQRQPLLPFKLSRAGPALAWGDVDGDGRDDLYVTGSPSQPGRLFRNLGQGRFTPDPEPLIDLGIEEVAALFFEANGDGFPDLYLVCGGVATEPNSPVLRDRLFLNDGKGRLLPALPGTLPDACHSGGTVVAADWDRDGDLDLFVGSRSVPGQYPRVPESLLLRNDAGKFHDVTDAVAPALRRVGLVTGALWSDADNDGWLDLLITCDWGPVRWFRNVGGRLEEQTRPAGLADRLGWWNGITAADVDGDGDLDYVVTNFGRNSRYQPTPEEPLRLYHSDFEGRGEPQLIEALVTREGLRPVRGRSALVNALPSLAARFPTHRAFATATLPELLGQSALDAAYQVEVNTLESGLLRNDGQGRFTFLPLPPLAQIAPAYGAVLLDVDGDRCVDLYLAQNTFSPQRETGRQAGGVSLLFRGNGDGTFTPVWPDRSGLLVPGEGRSVTHADLDDDGRPDVLVGVHDGELQAFLNRAAPPHHFLTVRLRGSPANPAAVGARVTVQFADGRQQTAEVYAGNGHLSQSGSALVFGLGEGLAVRQCEVRWPD